MKKILPSKLLKEDIGAIIKSSWKQLLGISVLIGFLLFILNIFLSLSIYTNQFSGDLRDKLGMFFYIKDEPGQEHVIYKQIMDLKDDLQEAGLQVMFSSKEDAFKSLQKRVPGVITNFQKFGIDNPLPATLYVMFDNEQEYQVLRSTILEYKDMILNIKDIDQGKTLKQQENRVLTIINMTNFVENFAYILIFVLSLIIFFFLIFLLDSIFRSFRKDLQIKKLLGATHVQVIQSFLIITLMVLLVGFITNWILIVGSGYTAGHYIQTLFDLTLSDLLGMNIGDIFTIAFTELVAITVISTGISYAFLKSLNKRI